MIESTKIMLNKPSKQMLCQSPAKFSFTLPTRPGLIKNVVKVQAREPSPTQGV